VSLEEQTRKNTPTFELHERAFKYKLKSASSYNFSMQNPASLNIDFTEAQKNAKSLNYLPKKAIDSEIINFEQLTLLWSFLPEVVRIRIP
jgi:hypothetical protein